MIRSRAVLVALVVVGGIVHWQSDRMSAADRTAGEACALYRSVAQASLSRSLDPGRIDTIDEALSDAATAAADAADQDRKYDRLSEVMDGYNAAASRWVELHNLFTGEVDPADMTQAERAYGAAAVLKPEVDAACSDTPFVPSGDRG